METSESIQSRETCLGLPFVEERSISEDERAMLQQEARQSLGRSLGWGCLSPVLFIAFIMTLASIAMDSNSNFVQMAPAIIFIICTVCVMIFFMSRTESHYKTCKSAKQDLRDGNVKLYQGFAPGIDKDYLPEANERPELSGEIAGVDVSVFAPISLEVFCGSRRLRQVNGTRVEMIMFLPEEHTALQPEQAKIAAKWVEPARIIADNSIDISQGGQRDLSVAEISEIRHYARTAWRKTGFGALLFTIYLCGFMILQWLAISSMHLGLGAYLSIAFTIWMNIKFVKAARLSWQLSKDVTDGIVFITRLPDEMNGEEMQQKGAVVEWLPQSNSEWTINGEPAEWRLRG